MLIAQISDFHIKARGKIAYRVVDTAAFLERAVEALMRLDPAPDIVLATGDLTDFGRPEEHELLEELLGRLPMPVYMIPGNHDERENLRIAFAGAGYFPTDGFLNYTVEDWPVRIVALDTVVPTESGGRFCAEREAWLDATLAAAPDRPTLIMMHHPPFRTGIGHMDLIGLEGSERFAAVLERHGQVGRVVCGHLHRSIATRIGSALVTTCPSVAHQVALDIRHEAPSRFVMEPPGYQLHVWGKDDGWITHTGVIGEFAGPYPFFSDGKLID